MTFQLQIKCLIKKLELTTHKFIAYKVGNIDVTIELSISANEIFVYQLERFKLLQRKIQVIIIQYSINQTFYH